MPDGFAASNVLHCALSPLETIHGAFYSDSRLDDAQMLCFAGRQDSFTLQVKMKTLIIFAMVQLQFVLHCKQLSS